MKDISSISTRMVLLGICLLLTIIGYSREMSDTLVITNYEKFKEIPTCIGKICQGGQCYAPPTTDGPAADYLLHQDVRIGKIRHCTMVCETPGGVCRKMIFMLPSAEAVEQAGKQAARQFGKPLYKKEDSRYVYSWTFRTSDNHQLKIRLEVDADLKSGMMYIHGQE